MALIIPTLKLGNKTTENAYAKVGREHGDNDAKTVSFNTVIYKSKEDRTVLLRLPSLKINTVVDIDIYKQCYAGIKAKITEIEGQIAIMQAEQDAAGNKATPQLKWELAKLKATPILLLKGSIDKF